MTIESVVKSISKERISTYKKPHLSANESESLGLYLWNKRLSSLLLPPLQTIEISLRNALHDSYIESCRNHGVEEENIDFLWFKTASANIAESQRHIDHAERQLNRESKPLTPANYISKLPLGFWVSFCDKKFSVGNNNGNIELWPTLRTLAFPGAVEGGNPLSIDRISSDLKAINSLRNRIAHHETIFNDGRHYHFESAINKVVKSFGRCITVIKWINPSNLKLINLLENDAKFAELCARKEVEVYKQLPATMPDLDVTHMDKWEENNLINERLNGEVVSVKKFFVIIKDSNSKTVFFCHKNYLPKKKLLDEGTLVNFVPHAPQHEGHHASAQKVKKGHI